MIPPMFAPCPRCGCDNHSDYCANSDGSCTYRCAHCDHLFKVHIDDDFYMGDDARFNAIRGMKTKPETDND